MKASPRDQHWKPVDDADANMRDPMARRETLELVRTYYSIDAPKYESEYLRCEVIATTINGD